MSEGCLAAAGLTLLCAQNRHGREDASCVGFNARLACSNRLQLLHCVACALPGRVCMRVLTHMPVPLPACVLLQGHQALQPAAVQ